LRGDTKSVRYTVEEGEHRNNVDRFRNLILAPAASAQFLNIIGSRAICRFCNQFHVVEQRAFGRSQARLIELTLENRVYALIACSLNTQEVHMTVQSIRAMVQVRDIAGNHFLVTAGEVAFGKMNGVRELNHLPKEIRSGTKTLEDARYLLSA